MISELIYTTPYPNINIIKTLAVVRGMGFFRELTCVAATFLVVTATMRMMIIVIILTRVVVLEDTVNYRSAAVLKDVALLL